MNVIRRFEDERKQWEAEREQLEEKGAAQDQELARLAEEVKRLRCTGPAKPLCGPDGSSVAEESDCNALVANLRGDLQKERNRTRELQQHAAMLSDELDQTKRVLEPNSGVFEAQSLEDENLWLRTVLNKEKAQVIDLKKAANSRREAWKEQLEEVTRELAEKQRLEEEVAKLRHSQSRDRLGLERALELEGIARKEIEKLRKDWQEDREYAQIELKKAQDELRTSSAYFQELVDQTQTQSLEGERRAAAAEADLEAQVRTTMEITEQLQNTTQLLDLFLGHAQKPLGSIQRRCSEFTRSGEAGEEALDWKVPILHEANAGDLQGNLVKIVSLLRFSSDVLDARHVQRKSKSLKQQGPQSWQDYTPIRME